jgi:hypothetical protein
MNHYFAARKEKRQIKQIEKESIFYSMDSNNHEWSEGTDK